MASFVEKGKGSLRDSFTNAGGIKNRGTHSSRSYKKFFEGYVEEYQDKPNGKGCQLIRRYVGSYYIVQENGISWLATKFLYTGVFIISTCLFVIMSLIDVGITNNKAASYLTEIPLPVCSLAALWCLVGILNLLMAPKRMTIGEYNRSIKSLNNSTTLYSACLLVATVARALCLIYCSPEKRTLVILSCLGILMSSLLIFLIRVAEKKKQYTEVPGELCN